MFSSSELYILKSIMQMPSLPFWIIRYVNKGLYFEFCKKCVCIKIASLKSISGSNMCMLPVGESGDGSDREQHPKLTLNSKVFYDNCCLNLIPTHLSLEI